MNHEHIDYPHPLYLAPVKPGWPQRRVDDVEFEMRERARLIAEWFAQWSAAGPLFGVPS